MNGEAQSVTSVICHDMHTPMATPAIMVEPAIMITHSLSLIPSFIRSIPLLIFCVRAPTSFRSSHSASCNPLF